jgi:nicotinamide phosphoribosyltransferase
VRGEEREVFKKPVTDPSKNSKAGKLKLIKTLEGELMTVKRDMFIEHKDELVEVFRDGEITREYSFDEVRANTNV